MRSLNKHRNYKAFCPYGSIYLDPVLQEYGKWIKSFTWHWCITVTIAGTVPVAVAKQGLINLLLHHSASAKYLLISEPCKSKSLHIHGLIAGLPEYRRLPLQDELTWRYGRSLITPYDPDGGWAFYIAKYLKLGYAQLDTNAETIDNINNEGTITC
jgi:hypothetical protein